MNALTSRRRVDGGRRGSRGDARGRRRHQHRPVHRARPRPTRRSATCTSSRRATTNFDQVISTYYDVVDYGPTFGASPAGLTIQSELNNAVGAALLGEKTTEEALADAQDAAMRAYDSATTSGRATHQMAAGRLRSARPFLMRPPALPFLDGRRSSLRDVPRVDHHLPSIRIAVDPSHLYVAGFPSKKRRGSSRTMSRPRAPHARPSCNPNPIAAGPARPGAPAGRSSDLLPPALGSRREPAGDRGAAVCPKYGIVATRRSQGHSAAG